MNKHAFWVGCFVLITACAVSILWFRISNAGQLFSDATYYTIDVPFTDVGGLRERAPVMIGGVRIGRVERIALNAAFTATTTLSIDARYGSIPIDSLVSVRTMGLLGEQFVSIDAQSGGFEAGVWQDGTTVDRRYAQSAVAIDQLIAEALFRGN